MRGPPLHRYSPQLLRAPPVCGPREWVHPLRRRQRLPQRVRVCVFHVGRHWACRRHTLALRDVPVGGGSRPNGGGSGPVVRCRRQRRGRPAVWRPRCFRRRSGGCCDSGRRMRTRSCHAGVLRARPPCRRRGRAMARLVNAPQIACDARKVAHEAGAKHKACNAAHQHDRNDTAHHGCVRVAAHGGAAVPAAAAGTARAFAFWVRHEERAHPPRPAGLPPATRDKYSGGGVGLWRRGCIYQGETGGCR